MACTQFQDIVRQKLDSIEALMREKHLLVGDVFNGMRLNDLRHRELEYTETCAACHWSIGTTLKDTVTIAIQI